MNWKTRLNSEFRQKLKSSNKDYLSIHEMCVFVSGVLSEFQKQEIVKNNSRLAELIEENIDHFSFCSDFATGSIPKSEWEDYDFDGDLLGMFNSYLSEFWDICDTYVAKDTKFCFVEL